MSLKVEECFVCGGFMGICVCRCIVCMLCVGESLCVLRICWFATIGRAHGQPRL